MERPTIDRVPDLHEDLRRSQERVGRLARRHDETLIWARRIRSQRDALVLAVAALFVVLCLLLLAG